MSFVHLHTHSHYSLLDGLAKIDALIAKALEYKMPALAITDHGNLYGAIEFYKKAKKAGLKPIIGVEAYLAPNSLHQKGMGAGEDWSHIILLAKNYEGYQNLLKLVTIAHLEGFYYKPRIDKSTLAKHSAGLIGLSACMDGELSKAVLQNFEKAKQLLREYQNIFGKENFFIEISHHPNWPGHAKIQELLIKLAKETETPLVATQDVHYVNKEDADAQDVLLAVQTNTKVTDQNRLTMKGEDWSFRSPEEMKKLFSDLPETIENTVKIAEMVNLQITLGGLHFPNFPIPAEYKTAENYLAKLAEEGLKKRRGEAFSEENASEENYKKQLVYELSVITKTGFAPYFLIIQDIVNWAKDNGIVVGPGRGSAAGSLVSYVLNITDIDPLKYGLIFERFINPDRVSPPDIDLDFADIRRDEVYEYAAQKYGRENVAQIITFGTIAARQGVRDAGRALNYSYSYCDELAKMIPLGASLDEALEQNPEFREMYKKDGDAKKIIETAKKLEGIVRHASLHACGVVISPEPLANKVPLQRVSSAGKKEEKREAIVTQYEMHAIEDIGLLKMDFLGLKNLSIIELAVNLIKEQRNIDIDLKTISLDDKNVYEMLSKGSTVGVFQLEGEGMTRYLMELKPKRLEDLTAMVALFRPGPMALIPSYIHRKHGREKIEYPHQKLKPVLEETYGILVYQEQLMEIAKELAGFTMAEADILRKAVGKKIKELLEEQSQKFIKGVAKTTGDAELGKKIWKWIEPFAGYGFNKSHSVGYSFLAYQTAYLKCRYPLEFMTALLNSEKKDIERIAFLVEECRKMGIKVLPPDINTSEKGFTITSGPSEPAIVKFGLTSIKNVGGNVVEAIIEERRVNGPFGSIYDLLERVLNKDLNKKSLESLIKAGAIDSLGQRKDMLANTEKFLNIRKEVKNSRNHNQVSLFGSLSPSGIENAGREVEANAANQEEFSEKLKWEKELLGMYISGHPLDRFKDKFKTQIIDVSKIKRFPPSTPVSFIAFLEDFEKIMTKRGEPMLFLNLADLSGKMQGIVFPSALRAYAKFIRKESVIAIRGKVAQRAREPGVIIDEIKEVV